MFFSCTCNCLKSLFRIHTNTKCEKYIPQVSSGLVTRVYDGDTIFINSYLDVGIFPKQYEFCIRIRGIDCPEIKTKINNQKIVAKRAKKRVENLILNQNIKLQNISLDKYGRLLCDVITKDNMSIKEILLNEHLAVKYDGKTKKIPSNWLAYNESIDPSE